MEELAKLEAERGNPEYLETEYGEGGVRGGRSLKGSGAGESFRRQEGAGRGGPGKGRDRRASNEMCIFLILNITSVSLSKFYYTKSICLYNKIHIKFLPPPAQLCFVIYGSSPFHPETETQSQPCLSRKHR